MRRRAVATLVLGAGVPMGVLAYLALRSIALERGAETQEEEHRARKAATAVVDRFQDLLDHAEEGLARQVQSALARVDPEPPDEEPEPGVLLPPALNARGLAVARALDALKSEALASETFLVSSQGRLVWPRVVRRPGGAHELDPRDRDLVRSALREGEPESAKVEDVAWAEIALRNALELCHDEDLRCLLRMKQVDLALRKNEIDRSLVLLRLVRAREGARDLEGEPLAPRAARRLAEVAALAGRPEEGLAALLDAALAIAEDRWGQEPYARRDLFETVVAESRHLAATLPAESASRAERALEHAEARAAFLDELDVVLRDNASAFRRRTHAASPDPARAGEPLGKFVRVGQEISGETRLFAVAPLEGPITRAAAVTSSSRAEGKQALVGVEIDLPKLRERLAAEVASVESTTEERIAILDGEGVPFGGDSDLAAASQRVPGYPRKFAATADVPLAEALPGWRVLAAPRDPDAPVLKAALRLQLSGALVAICALVALGAFVLALRAASREVEVARVRTDLVRNVSHELRTPVASILMLAEVLEEGGLPETKQGEYVTRIVRESRRLAKLIENVLDIARIERGARKVDLRPAPLGETVSQAVATFKESEEGRAAQVSLDLASGDALVPLDPGAMEQVLVNLISNAVKYSPEGEPVVVASAVSEHEARISVRDRGRGLTPEEQRRLFAPFYRARPEDGNATGVGLGLVITRELIRLQGGRLEVESAPGRGSSFVVVLPRANGS
ncbi:HAMP domain-containing histidine kinase [bacterium]|nr:HAMP domain-containing histidine kinase [bacterium]